MTRLRLILFAVTVLLVFLVARFPLELAAGSGLPVGARASGTVWDGVIDGVSLPGSEGGRITVAGHPFRLALLGYSADWAAQTLLLEANGTAETSVFGARRLIDSEIRLDISAVRLPIPLFGQVRAQIETIEFDTNGACQAAVGRWNTDALVRSGPNYGWAGPQLAGPITCEAGSLVFALAGSEAGTDVRVEVRVPARGLAQVRADITAPPAALNFALLQAGFSVTETGALSWSDEIAIDGALR